MLTAYINAAMQKAHYEILPDNEGYFGKIEGLQGVWANANTLEDCREELREVLEEWILLGIKMGHIIPLIDGIDLNIKKHNLRRGDICLCLLNLKIKRSPLWG